MSGNGRPAAVFELLDPVPAGTAQDMMGLWTTVPYSPEEMADARVASGRAAGVRVPSLVFGAAAAHTGDTAVEASGQPLVWRANFPASQQQTAAHLVQAYTQLGFSAASLAATPARVGALLTRTPASMVFATPGLGPEPSKPEQELALLLAVLEAQEGTVAYGVGDEIVKAWRQADILREQAVAAFRAFAQQLQTMLSHFSWVETRVAGQLIGQTRVAWSGDVDTLLVDRPRTDQIHWHNRSVDLALETRRQVLRTAVLIASTAAKLVALLATPAGAALILPALLRFIQQVRVEIEKSHNMKREA